MKQTQNVTPFNFILGNVTYDILTNSYNIYRGLYYIITKIMTFFPCDASSPVNKVMRFKKIDGKGFSMDMTLLIPL